MGHQPGADTGSIEADKIPCDQKVVGQTELWGGLVLERGVRASNWGSRGWWTCWWRRVSWAGAPRPRRPGWPAAVAVAAVARTPGSLSQLSRPTRTGRIPTCPSLKQGESIGSNNTTAML